MAAHDFHSRARAARARSGARFRVGGAAGGGGRFRGFSRKSGVVVRSNGYRKHRGRGAVQGAGGKMKDHIIYVSGERRKGLAREQRQLYDDHGRKQTALEARERHADPFIEHRLIVSPSTNRGKCSEDDLHLLAQAVIQDVRARNPKAEVTASYGLHFDNSSPHAHLLFTSDQMVRLDKKDFQELREMTQDIHKEIQQMRSKGLSYSSTLEIEHDNKIDHDLGLDKGLDQGMDLGV